MSGLFRPDKRWLLAIARMIAQELKSRSSGTQLRIRLPSRSSRTNSDGWAVVIGDLDPGQVKLDIWLDRFACHDDRKLYAGFRASKKAAIDRIKRRVSGRLWPVRQIGVRETTMNGYFTLNKPLPRAEFNVPLLEYYPGGETYYGIFDTTHYHDQSGAAFRRRAVAFFEDVAREQPNAKPPDDDREVFPRCENRRRVASHLRRERSRLLATECKLRDNYVCQVCGLCFDEFYGPLGEAFAEAHHLVPLGKLTSTTVTRLEDLTTVCANCHRMLHRMNGVRSDFVKLRAVVRQRRRKL